MSKAILQNDVIDVIYDSICGYPLDEAYEILENHRVGKYIPIEWILKWACEFIDPYSEGYKMAMELVHDWEKENDLQET